MKQKIIFTTIIALALYSQLVSAGSIADTYTTGNTLTATMLDNIKTAVNNNDSNSDANTNNIGINTNDISVNADDITINSGDITALDNTKPVVAYDRTICSNFPSTCPADYLTTTASTVTSVTINAPTTGKVIVSFSGQYGINHTVGTLDLMCIELKTSSTAVPIPRCDGVLTILVSIDASHRLIDTETNDLTGFYNGGIHSQQIFNVNAGTHTFYVRGQSTSSGTTIYIRQSNVIAHFVAD